MTRVLALFAALAVFATIVGCSQSPVQVGPDASGSTVTLRPGQGLTIELESNASTGFRWAFTTEPDAAVLALAGNDYQAPSADLLGAPGKEAWRFTAVKAGTTSLTLVYARPWESVMPEKTFTLTVEVK